MRVWYPWYKMDTTPTLAVVPTHFSIMIKIRNMESVMENITSNVLGVVYEDHDRRRDVNLSYFNS